jgi:1-acyl-sn-glycerol-3-phosphate acyltransferase
MRKEAPPRMKQKKPGKFFGQLFRLCRFIWRTTHNRQSVLGMENVGDLPAVFIARHQDMYGPVEIMAWVPLDFRVWTFYKFMTVKECFRHYYNYTFSVRKGYKPWMALLRAAFTAPFVAAFMRSMGGIPVYRGCKNIADTFKESVKALRNGDNILIMPERDYMSTGADAGELYTGFVHIAQLYSKSTGKPLSFYPIYASKQNEKIYMEKPIVFDPAKPFRSERDRIVAELKNELSRSAVEQEFHIAAQEKAAEARPSDSAAEADGNAKPSGIHP